MNILVIGDAQRYEALQRKGGLGAHLVQWEPSLDPQAYLQPYQLVIDLAMDDHLQYAGVYARFPQTPVLACIVKTSLAALMHQYVFTQGFNIIGCNWLPGFIEMPVTEVSVIEEKQRPLVQDLMGQLGWQYEIVADSVGLVTPRVVSMIINEAYMAAAEGTASREDIDIAMRLGTNYPAGPFEWCERIGAGQVCAVLDAVYAATGHERYKVSELLRSAAG